ncbi:MAG: exo-alpha-sialidase [Opitutaceae bacterium]|nr:exo-alpha-sialidase [Opitutaceae bacterium]
MLASLGSAQAPQPAATPYTWKNVQIVGGGFVDGIVLHPTAPGVRYARTDMGSAYRWDAPAKRWAPLLDWMPYEDHNLMGVESIALDAADPARVYLACGTYTNPGTPNGAILRSHDYGRTWQRTDVPFKFGGNEDGRGNGERLAVDPNDGRILFLGTRRDGLWTSRDGAATWARVSAFPDVTEKLADPQKWWEGGAGIVFVVLEPASGAKGKASATLYAGVSLMGRANLFCSTDAGTTWQPVAGQPTQYRPTHGVLAADGTLYLTYATSPGPSWSKDGAVWKLNTKTGDWTDITPFKPATAPKPFGYAAVSVDAHNPRALIVSTYGHIVTKALEDEIFRSTDAGATWKPVFAGGGQFDASLSPYVLATPLHWMFDIEIDPTNPDHALCTTGYGGWETFNLTAVDSGRPSTWSIMARGIEETVAMELVSPVQGAPLVSAVLDYGSFVHWDLDQSPPEGESQPSYLESCCGIASADGKPEVLVRVGKISAHHSGANIGYSLDSGRTWKEPSSPPGAGWGNIALSSDAATWLWAPGRQVASFTRDLGQTWTPTQGLPANTRVIADRVDAARFYAMDLFAGKLFVSGDGAATFHEQPLALPGGLPKREGHRGDNRGGQDRLYATPGFAGHLWIAAYDGLYQSSDTGTNFARLPGVAEIHGFGFGKAAPGQEYPAIYLVGVVDGLRGFFRSDDRAATWVQINDDQHQLGLVLHISGDPKQYGRVYIGTHGRGILYGDPVAR